MRRVVVPLALVLVGLCAAPARAETSPSPGASPRPSASPTPSASPAPSPSPSPSPAAPTFDDVPNDHWAAPAIKTVAVDHDFMQGAQRTFRPGAPVTRRELARALVRAFAPGAQPDAALTFSDLPSSDPDYPAADVAVKRGWLAAPNNAFAPEASVTKRQLDRTLLVALGAQAAIRGLSAIHTQDGTALAHPSDMAVLALANVLGLHHNYSPDESNELMAWSAIRRQDAAFAIARAFAIQGQWQVQQLARYDDVTLPNLTQQQRAAAQFALSYVGYPYVWGGEWFRSTASGYCCGAQASGGFDCSGFSWWALRAPAGSWDNTKWRPYAGWALPERTSYDMAKGTKARIALGDVRPLDVLLFDTDSVTSDGTDWQSVDHVGVALGNGWMIHSSGGRAGVTVDWVGDGWWHDHFRWARRIAA
jgi:cell wall-associated NlpC family hydrolase